MAKCDIKIMASKRRYAYVLNMCKIIGLDIDKDVFFDDRPNGGLPAYTAERTWNLPFDDGVTHRCVLQDDLILCKDFRSVLNQLVEAKPDAVFSLFCPQSKMLDYREKYGCPQLIKNKKCGVWGQAVVAPKAVALDFFPWGHKIAAEHGGVVVHDDVLYGEYALANGVDVFIPIPGTVQHLCPTQSLLGFNNKNKVSKVFDMEAGKLEWNDAVESSVSIPNSTAFYKIGGVT